MPTMSTTMSHIWNGFQTPYGPRSWCGSTGRITSDSRTNCMIARMPGDESACSFQCHIEIVDAEEQEEPVARCRPVRAHQRRMLVRAPLVKAEQNGSIRIEDLTKVGMARLCLGLAEERLVPFEAPRHITHTDDRPCPFHGISAGGLTRRRMELAGSGVTWTGSPKEVFAEENIINHPVLCEFGCASSRAYNKLLGWLQRLVRSLRACHIIQSCCHRDHAHKRTSRRPAASFLPGNRGPPEHGVHPLRAPEG